MNDYTANTPNQHNEGSSLELDPEAICHPSPASVPVTLQLAQIHAGHRQAAVVQEPADLFHALAGLATQLGGRVPENMDSGASTPH